MKWAKIHGFIDKNGCCGHGVAAHTEMGTDACRVRNPQSFRQKSTVSSMEIHDFIDNLPRFRWRLHAVSLATSHEKSLQARRQP